MSGKETILSYERARIALDNMVNYLSAAVTLYDAKALMRKKKICAMWRNDRSEGLGFYYHGWFIRITNDGISALNRAGDRIYVTR